MPYVVVYDATVLDPSALGDVLIRVRLEHTRRLINGRCRSSPPLSHLGP